MATGTIGAKIVLEGEAAYRKALRDIKTEQTQLRSEMKLCQSEFAKSQNSMDALTKKHEVLAKQLDASAKKVEVYQKALQTSTEKEAKSKQKVEELTKTLEKLEAEQKSMAESSEANADAMEKQEKQIAETRKQLEVANSNYEKAVDATKKYQTQLNLAEAELNDINNALKDNDKYLDEAKQSTDGCATSINELGKTVKETDNDLNVFGEVLKANLSSQVIIDGIKNLVNGVKEVAEACIESGMEFESAMSNVKALSGATDAELERMADKAKELGASTIYSASQVADAMSYMALAGWNTEQTLMGVDSVLNLAASASMDLAQASDIVTDYLTAFGLKAEDASKFTDMLAFTMANSNTTVEMLGESYKNCAATASSMGYAVEDVTAVLATMANAGVKGGEAGTALNSIMTRLATNTKGCADKLEDYGVAIYDSKGNMQSLSSILEGLGEVWGTLTDQEQAALAKSIAGTNQYASLQTIMNGLSESAKESGMSFGDYQKALQDCTGSAEEMAKVMQDNLKGKLTALDSAMEGLKIATYEVFDENLKTAVEQATKAVGKLTESVSNGRMNTSLAKLSQSIGGLVDRTSAWAEKNLPKIIDGLATVIDHSDEIIIAIKAIVAGILTFKTATTAINVATTAMTAYKLITEGATVAQIAMNVAADANPYVLLASALVAVGVAMVGIVNNAKDATYAMDEGIEKANALVESSKELRKIAEDEKKASEETKKGFEEQTTVTRNLVNELDKLQKGYSEGKTSISDMQIVVDELNALYPSLNLQLDKNTGKLNKNTSEILSNTDALIKQAETEAAQKDLLRIAEQKYEAEKKLAGLESERTELQEKYNNALQEMQDMNALSYFELLSAKMDGSYDLANQKLLDAQEALYKNEIEVGKLTNLLPELQTEYDTATNYIEQNTGAIDTSTGAYDGLNDSLSTTIQLSDETAEAISGMYDSVSSAISGQINLFNEWQEKEAISSETLKKNLESQTQALTTWADNMAILSERGIDDGLYKKLAEMGPEGANYVQAFVNMSEAELKTYGDKFAKAVELKDDVAKQITEDYAEAAGYIMEGIALGLEDDGTVLASMGTLSKNMWEQFCEDNGIHSPSKVYEELTGYITDGMVSGLDKGESDVTDKMTRLSNNLKTIASSVLSTTQFETIGKQISRGLANGIESESGMVYDAVTNMCNKVVKNAQKTLDIHSPSKKFEWLGEMSGEGYINGLESSISDVDNTIKSAMNTYSVVGNSATQKSSGLNEIVGLLTEYLPELVNADTNVNVSLQGDAQGLFRAIRTQNDAYTKSTGRSAFA